MKRNNRIVVDINKCQWALLYYENQHGDRLEHKPKFPTVFCQAVPEGPHCTSKLTMLEHAKKYNLLDIWTPVVRLKLTAHECLEYTGEKALSIYKAWCEKIFKKEKK